MMLTSEDKSNGIIGSITGLFKKPVTHNQSMVHPCIIDGKYALVYENDLQQQDRTAYERLFGYAKKNNILLKEDQRHGARSIKNDRSSKLIPLVFLGVSFFSQHAFSKENHNNVSATDLGTTAQASLIHEQHDALTASYEDNQELMAGLIGWINDHSSYSYNIESLPDVKFVPIEGMAKVAFGKSLPKNLDLKTLQIYGLYNFNEKTVYMLDSVDMNTENGRAILLHELVHYLQYQHGQDKDVKCKNELEALAYVLEAKYLQSHDEKVEFSMDHVRRVSQCKA